MFELHVSDLGGEAVITEAERSIVRRAATLTVELERLEAKFANDQAADGALDLYQRGANSLRRLLESVGLERRARDVTPRRSAQLSRGQGQGGQLVSDPFVRLADAGAPAGAGGDPPIHPLAEDAGAERMWPSVSPNRWDPLNRWDPNRTGRGPNRRQFGVDVHGD